MKGSDLLDSVRIGFINNSEICPTREIVYTRDVDSVSVTLPALVGGGVFNKIEKEAIGRFQSFVGLPLTTPPVVNDSVSFDGQTWKVVRYTKLGQLYTVYCENRRHNGRPSQ